jgi:uncharacterized protein (DUF885 family)
VIPLLAALLGCGEPPSAGRSPAERAAPSPSVSPSAAERGPEARSQAAAELDAVGSEWEAGRGAAGAMLARARAIDADSLGSNERTGLEALSFELDLAVRYDAIEPDALRRIGRAPLHRFAWGPDAYRVLLYEHSSLELDPAELRAFAESELASSERVLLDRARALGADAADVPSLRRWLARERARFALGSSELLGRTLAAIARVDPARVMDPPPRDASAPRVVIEPRSGYALGRYAFARDRPTFFVRVPAADDLPRIYVEPLAFHEALPGHHLQALVGRRAPGRRFADYSAFSEGWALHAERLADELGLYSDPWARVGLAAFRAWRAARMRVDLGLHLDGWSERRARAYLAAHTILGRLTLVKEVRRVIADPAQSIAYLVGERELLRERARAAAVLGDRFDERRFHAVLLGSGPVPFSTMHRLVGEWIEREAAPTERTPSGARSSRTSQGRDGSGTRARSRDDRARSRT